MKLKLFKAVLLASFVLVSSIVFAKKPISPEMKDGYAMRADLIVKGLIDIPVQCSKIKSKDYCPNQPAYSAPLKVEKIIKGKLEEKTIQITFCSSGPTSAPVSGERGTYYFKKSPKGDWQLTFSDEVVYAAGALPNCR